MWTIIKDERYRSGATFLRVKMLLTWLLSLLGPVLNTMQMLKWTHIYNINHKAILIVQKRSFTIVIVMKIVLEKVAIATTTTKIENIYFLFFFKINLFIFVFNFSSCQTVLSRLSYYSWKNKNDKKSNEVKQVAARMLTETFSHRIELRSLGNRKNSSFPHRSFS